MNLESAVVTCLNNCIDRQKTELTLKEALDYIRTSELAADKIRQIRAAPPEKRNSEKVRLLQCYAFTGKFNGSVSKAGFLEGNGLFCVDIDHIHHVESAKRKISAIPYVAACFVSPSGDGLKAVLHIPPVSSDADIKVLFPDIENLFKQAGFTIDPARKDICGLCFISSDPDIYVNYQAQCFRPPNPLIDQIVSILQHARPGERHHARIRAGRLAGGYIAGGLLDEAEAMACLIQASDSIADGGRTNDSELKTIDDAIINGKLFPLSSAKEYKELPAQTAQNELFPFVPARELTSEPIRINWLIENIIEEGSLNLLFGEPGAGKSLFALDWAFCVSSGLEWHGCRTKQKDVIIIAGEGFAGMSRRLKALEAKYHIDAPMNLLISKRPGQLMQPENAKWIADSISALSPRPGLVVIDTLHRNMDGDENSSQDIGRFINNLDLYLKPLGMAILVVHHSGHGQKDRGRGSSSIRAAMDGEFGATKDHNRIILACHKAKDFEAFRPMQFRLTPSVLDWVNEDGECMTSVYLEHEGEAVQLNCKNSDLSARDREIFDSLAVAMTEHGKPSETGQRVHIDYWRMEAYKTMPNESPEARKKSFQRSRKKLFEQDLFLDFGDYVGLP